MSLSVICPNTLVLVRPIYLTNTGEAGSLAGFNIEIESLYSASIDAGDVTDTVAISLTGLPVAKSLDCKLTALNEYGIRGETRVFPGVTPPVVTGPPVVTEVEAGDGGVWVYFTPAEYTLWGGQIAYRAICDSGSSVIDLSERSEPVIESPAFVPDLDPEQELSCRVEFDNVYESVLGPVYAYEPFAGGGLPIWLLYEATREREAE